MAQRASSTTWALPQVFEINNLFFNLLRKEMFDAGQETRDAPQPQGIINAGPPAFVGHDAGFLEDA